MCDYSLEHKNVRDAKVGDRLVTTIWRDSITGGFRDTNGDPDVAVCLRPGTELAFDRDVTCDHALEFFPTKNLGEKTARFRQLNPDMPHQHHDALEFPSGRVVLLTKLITEQTATVLQLPASDKPISTTEAEAMVEAQEVQPVT